MKNNNYKVVVVTRNKSIISDISTIFNKEDNFSIISISKSVEFASQNQVDVILLDWELEDANSIKDICLHAPVVYIFSKKIGNEVKSKALKKYGYVVYPFHKDAVLNTLHLALQKFRLKKEVDQSRKIKSLRIFAAGIAHDFNNLLGAIIGYTELLKFKTKNSEELSRYADLILKASDTARMLVEQLTVFSRNWERLEKQRFPFHIILKETLRSEKSDLLRELSVIEDINKQGDEIYADPYQVYLLCLSLLKALENILKLKSEIKISLKGNGQTPRQESGNKIICMSVEVYKQDLILKNFHEIKEELNSVDVFEFLEELNGNMEIVELDDNKIVINIFIPTQVE